MSPNRVWIVLFSAWGMFLSGAFAGVIGAPGVVQVLKLQSLLQERVAKVREMEHQVQRLQIENRRLERNRTVQQREVRRVLGYAAPDELVFDFGSNPNL